MHPLSFMHFAAVTFPVTNTLQDGSTVN